MVQEGNYNQVLIKNVKKYLMSLIQLLDASADLSGRGH